MAKRDSERRVEGFEPTDGDVTREEAKSMVSELIRVYAPDRVPADHLRILITQMGEVLTDLVRPVARPTGDDPLLGYSIIGRMCGRSPQTIRRWTLEGLLKSEIERPGAPRRIRLSVVRQFFSAGTLDLREVQEKFNGHEEIRG